MSANQEPIVSSGYLTYDEDREEWVVEMGNWEPPTEMNVKRLDDGIWVEVTIRRYGFQP